MDLIPQKDIENVRRALRDANMDAARYTGFRRYVSLKFAAILSWLYDEAQAANQDAQRGKDDNHYNEH